MADLRPVSVQSPFQLLLRDLFSGLPEEYRRSVRYVQWLLLSSAVYPFRPVACTVLPVSQVAPAVVRAELRQVAELLASDISIVPLNKMLAGIKYPLRFEVCAGAYVDGVWMVGLPGAFTLRVFDPQAPRDHVTLLTLPAPGQLPQLVHELYRSLPRS